MSTHIIFPQPGMVIMSKTQCGIMDGHHLILRCESWNKKRHWFNMRIVGDSGKIKQWVIAKKDFHQRWEIL